MEDNLIPILIGFIGGLIVWTYIHSCIIKYKLDKLTRVINEAYCESCSEIYRLEQDKEQEKKYVDPDRIERLKMCKEIFGILETAIHHC